MKKSLLFIFILAIFLGVVLGIFAFNFKKGAAWSNLPFFKNIFSLNSNQNPAPKLSLENSKNSSHSNSESRSQKSAQNLPQDLFAGEKTPEKSFVNLLFLGDLMLDRQMRPLIKDKGVPWLTRDIQRLFWSQDLNLANLEGSVTENQSVSVGSRESERRHFSFTFDPETTKKFIEQNRLNFIFLNNNHAQNFGKEGFQSTQEFLSENGVNFTGDPYGQENNVKQVQIKNKKIALINYSWFGKQDFSKLLEEIKFQDSQNNAVIVYTHWGVEYQNRESAREKREGRAMVDAGADLIVGSHPHSIEPIEIYKNRAIFYSLGNFIFDQNFSEPVRQRLALGVEFKDGGFTFYLTPLFLEKDGRLIFAKNQTRDKILAILATNFSANEEIGKAIKKGKFELGR